MNQIIQLSGKFLYRISRVWFTSKTTEPIVIEELEEALPRQMVEEQDADTPAAFYTATPGYSSSYQTPGRLNPDTNFGKALTQQKLVEAKEVEVNWSGRGQHVEFRPDDKIPLQLERAIGHSATAIVESVRCRRIRLARKSIRCRHGVKLKYLIREVSYLHRLRHPHIIQLVGTYLQKNTFAILLYPVATGDLTKFMDEWQLQYSQQNGTSSSATYYQLDLARFFFCLTSAVAFMHEKGIRHMDIKPSNILVHERRSFGKRTMRSVYL
jgi:serine/threonine protein kinase